MKVQAINQPMNNSKNKNVSFNSRERFLITKAEKPLVIYRSTSSDTIWGFTKIDNLESFIHFVFERQPKIWMSPSQGSSKGKISALISAYRYKGDSIDIFTENDLERNSRVFNAYQYRRDQSRDPEYTMKKDLVINNYYGALHEDHIHQVNSPGDILRVLEEKMPELGITYKTHKNLLQEWSTWLKEVQKSGWCLPPSTINNLLDLLRRNEIGILNA